MAGAVGAGVEGDFVAVFEEFAGFAVGQGEGFAAAAGDFHQGAPVGGFGAGDGSGAEEVAGVEVAAVAGVVGDHLGGGPVEVQCVADGEAGGGLVAGAHLGGVDGDFEGEVEGAVGLVLRV